MFKRSISELKSNVKSLSLSNREELYYFKKIRDLENIIAKDMENIVKSDKDTILPLMIAQARGSAAAKYKDMGINNTINDTNEQIKKLWEQIQDKYDKQEQNKKIRSKGKKKSKKTKKSRKTRKR